MTRSTRTYEEYEPLPQETRQWSTGDETESPSRKRLRNAADTVRDEITALRNGNAVLSPTELLAMMARDHLDFAHVGTTDEEFAALRRAYGIKWSEFCLPWMRAGNVVGGDSGVLLRRMKENLIEAHDLGMTLPELRTLCLDFDRHRAATGMTSFDGDILSTWFSDEAVTERTGRHGGKSNVVSASHRSLLDTLNGASLDASQMGFNLPMPKRRK